jgi:uncharacterized protein YbjT (DUF2867 family)
MTTAWVAGASGLVGGELLRLLVGDGAFDRVVSVGRRTVGIEAKKVTEVKVDFADAATFGSLDGADVAFSCLGTTIKKAGSKEAFRAVDHDAVLAFARAARSRGAKVLVHVSSLGADRKSRTFYASVKGEVEEDLAALGYESVYALRPSILDGDRAESRPLERVGLAFARALGPVLGKYRPTEASAVARVMVAKAKAKEPGAHVIDAGAIT